MTDFVELTRDPLDVGALSSLVAADSTGAVSIFAGTTRNNFEGKKVTRLEYEAYEPMARKVMLGLCAEIRKRWKGVLNVAVYHRLGPVGLREASVVIAVSSEHRRREGFLKLSSVHVFISIVSLLPGTPSTP